MKLKNILVALIFTMPLFVNTSSVRALDGCSDDYEGIVPYDSVVPLGEDIYEAYVKLNKQGQNATVAASITQLESESCTAIGEVAANDSTWVRIGEFDNRGKPSASILSLKVADAQASQDASGPSLLLVSKIAPPCPDVNKCLVTYGGYEYNLQPKKVSLNSDTLRVAMYSTVTDQIKIKKTLFFIDNQLSYSSASSTVFDKSYVSSGTHNLKTSVVLKDGQTLDYYQTVDNPYDFKHFILPYIQKYKTEVILILVITAAYAVFVFVVSVIRRFINSRKWKSQHIASVSGGTFENLNSTQVYEKYQKLESGKKDVKLTILICITPLILLGLYIFINSLVLGRFGVDGVSMETTLRNTSGQWLYKLPVTFSKLSSGSVSVKRGDVVVLRHDDNNLFDQTSESEKSYVVKRILGLPGERVQVKDGQLLITPVDAKEPLNPDKGNSWESVVQPSTGRYIDITLKAGELFVVGDNRIDSIDSRNYGPVKIDEVVGRVLYKVNPQNKPYNEDIYP